MPTSSADQVRLGVLSESLVGVDQATGPLVADLAVVEMSSSSVRSAWS